MHSVKASFDEEAADKASARPSDKRASPLVLVIAVVIAATVMALDLSTPLGVAGGVPYIALVLTGWWLPKRWGIFLLAVISSALTIAGYYLSPEGGIHWVVIVNRAYALFGIWITAIILWVARRSRALVMQRERELIQTKERMEKAYRAKSEFLANVSHELRTPLNAIIGFSSIMKSEILGPLSKKYLEYANDINYSGEHLLGLINDILDTSSVETNKTILNKEQLDFRKIAADTIRIIRYRAEREKVHISTRIDKDIPAIYADELRIKQVLINLLSNAVKFTPPGGTVSLNASIGENGTHVITVSDNGIGMNEDELAKAMTRFGQVENIFTRKYKGTGLGLPLAKELTELHGGTFNIHSEKGKGTTVTLSFAPIEPEDGDDHTS